MTNVVAIFTKIHEAYLARGRLQSEGIDSVIFDEYLVGIQPLYSVAIGGIKLAVKESDIQEANVILGLHIQEQQSIFEANMQMCPNCHSSNIRSGFGFHSITAFVLMILFGMMGLLLYKKRKCYNCGHYQAW